MRQTTDDVIGQLVAELEPVAPLNQRSGMGWMLLSLCASVLGVILFVGPRSDLLSARPDPVFLIATGLFFVLALASAWSAVDMARPSVGIRRSGWPWAGMMAAVLPGAALSLIALNLANGRVSGVDGHGWACTLIGMGIGLLTAATLLFWMRRGAPSAPHSAALLVGVASGAAGIFAISLCCPENNLIHIGLWHGGAVILTGIAGRLIFPRLLAW